MDELFNFRGKIGRLEYFQVLILCYLILGAYLLLLTTTFRQGLPWLSYLTMIVTFIIIGCVISIKVASVVKRLSDINLHPALSFFIFIPFINLLFSIYLLFAKGKKNIDSEPANEENPEVKTCIYCCAKIPYSAKKCMYCGEWVDIESFEEEMNKPNNYWTANIILAVFIAGLSLLPAKTDLTAIFSKDAFKTKVLADYYEEAQTFCKKFDFEKDTQKFHCLFTYIEDSADSKIRKDFHKINQNCRTLFSEEKEYTNCISKAIENDKT